MRARLQSNAELFGGLGLALWAIALIFFLIGNQPAERLWGIFLFGIVFLALYVYARPAQVEAVLTGRGVRYGSNALILALALIGIVALLNVLSARYHWRQDFTENQQFTLSQKTVEILKNLKEPVQALAFYSAQDTGNLQQIEDRLKDYATITDKFTYRFIDPIAEPLVVQDYKGIPNSVMLVRGSRRENIFSTDEQNLTNALLKVTQDTQPGIYFTIGHSEHSPLDTGDDGYSMLKASLEANNYKVDVLDLRTITETLPSDLTALVIGGPTRKFESSEVDAVRKFLGANGRVLILLDPQAESGLDALLKEWGLELRNDFVIDPRSYTGSRGTVPAIIQYKYHKITEDLTSEVVFLPGARSLATTSPTPSGKTVSALFASSDQSWGETDFTALKAGNSNYDANKDLNGPLDLAFAVEAPGQTDKPPRLVVIGNSTFANNNTFNQLIRVGMESGNGFLISNSLHWLAGQETLISIPPKSTDQRTVFLTSEQSNFVFWSSFLFLPAAILILGGIVWWRRR